MSKRWASILTIKSLSALSQVSSLPPPRPSLIYPQKILDNASSLILRRHSTAPDSPFQQAPGNVGPDYHHNPYGFYRENPYQQRSDGLLREGPGDLRRSPNENARAVTGEFHQTGDGRHWESTGNARYNQNNGEFYQEVPPQTADGFYRESARCFHPKPDTNNLRNGGAFGINSDRQYGNPNVSSDYVGGGGSNGEAYQHSGGLQREGQQRRDGLYREGPGNLCRSPNENARTVTGEFHQTGDGRHWESTGNARYNQKSSGFCQEVPPQRAGGFYGESTRGFHPHPDTNNMRNGRGFYNNSDREYGSNGEAYQNSDGLQRGNPGGSQLEYNGRLRSYGGHQINAHQNPYGFTREKQRGESVNYTWTPSESNADRPVEFQHHNSGFVNRGALDSPSMHGTNNEMVLPIAEPSGDDESSGDKGTIEEMDNLCKEGKIKEAVQVLSLLERRGVAIDHTRYLGLLVSCGEFGFLEEARVIHDHMSKVVHLDVGLHNRILDMYSKCGSMADACKLFERMPNRNLTSWDAMIRGLANNDLGEEAIDFFSQLKETRLKPDGQIFVTIFSACAVLGAVDEGLLHFESMQKDFNIVPGMEHYVGIVDLLGKSGYLDEAVEFIEKMPIEPSVDVWETLMNMCRMNGNKKLGDRCAEMVEHMDPSRYTEHAKKGLLPVKASELARENKIKKSRSLEVRRGMQEYRAGDRSDPEIYEQIRVLAPQMKEAGYVPETQWTLHDVDPESREEALLYHSERLAIAYGFMTSPARSTVRIIKNLRVCGDCHNALKVISKLSGRVIVARDAKRFHHFEKGKCSCKDFW